MFFWYVVELRSTYDERKEFGKIGAPISAEIIDVLPRKTDGWHEWHDTETIADGIYTRKRWCRTKKDAINEIKHHMKV